MFRLLITYLLPLFGPILLYLAWNAYAKARARKTGGEVPTLEKGHIFWSLIAGFFLLVVSLAAIAITQGEPADSGQYVPPRFEDGRIVPPTFQRDAQ